MHYLPIALFLLWYKISIVRFYMLMGKKDHKETTADAIMLFPIWATAWTLSKIKGNGDNGKTD